MGPGRQRVDLAKLVVAPATALRVSHARRKPRTGGWNAGFSAGNERVPHLSRKTNTMHDIGLMPQYLVNCVTVGYHNHMGNC